MSLSVAILSSSSGEDNRREGRPERVRVCGHGPVDERMCGRGPVGERMCGRDPIGEIMSGRGPVGDRVWGECEGREYICIKVDTCSKVCTNIAEIQ